MYINFIKPVFDKVISIILLFFILPFMIALALVILITGSKPFYCHERIGKDGKIFNLFKFRTMKSEDEFNLNTYFENNPDAKIEWDANFKLENDPRITIIGSVLRKYRIDELPQFWNVIIGDMSIVGPRPLTLDEIRDFKIPKSTYLKHKPGITGPWTTYLGKRLDYQSRIRLELSYNSQISFVYDLNLIFKTVLQIFYGRGM